MINSIIINLRKKLKSVLAISTLSILFVICFSGCYKQKTKPLVTNEEEEKYSITSTEIRATAPANMPIPVKSFQGFGYCNGVLFQFYSDNAVELIDYKSGKVIADLATETEHGNSIAFLNEYYDKKDEFPMAIVSDGLSNRAYKIRIQRSEVITVQTITFPIDKCGYYVSTMFDAANNILYTIGYTENHYYDNSDGNNNMVFCKWDISNLIDNSDSTVTPAFISSFTTPFMKTLQAPCYFKGKLYVVSSHWDDTETKIYVVDPYRKAIVDVMEDFPDDIKTIETEGIFVAEIEKENVAILKTKSSPYKLMKIK